MIERGPVLRAIDRLVLPGMIAFDIGANRGITAQALSEAGAITYAFEPIPECVAEIEARALANVTIIRTALSDKEGSAAFHLDSRAGTGMEASSFLELDGVSGATIEVPITTIDAFAEAHDMAPNFIKIDVEGVEEKVIAGGIGTIRRHRPIMIFEVWANNWHRFERIVSELSSAYRFECASDGAEAIARYSSEGVTRDDDIICLPRV